MNYEHAPGSAAAGASRNLGPAFKWAVALNAGYVLIEAGAGSVAGSLALLADAAHNLTDVAGRLIARATTVAAKCAPAVQHTHGLGRSTIRAALVNAIAILVGIGAVVWEAVRTAATAMAVISSCHQVIPAMHLPTMSPGR